MEGSVDERSAKPTFLLFKVALLIHLLASVYILCIDKLLKMCEKKFKHFELMKFIVSFITNVFYERDIFERTEFISSVFKGKTCEILHEIFNLQRDL